MLMALIVNSLGLTMTGLILVAAGMGLMGKLHAAGRQDINKAIAPFYMVGGAITLAMGIAAIISAIAFDFPRQFPAMGGAILATLFLPWVIPALFVWLGHRKGEKVVYPY